MPSQKFESDLQLAKLLHKPLLALGLVSTLGGITLGAIANSAQAASLTNWNFDPSANQLEITVKDGTTPRYFLMAQPARIVVDLPDTSIGAVNAQQSYAGAIRQIRVSQFQPGLTRIVMELSPNIALAPGQVQLQKVDQAKPVGSRWTVRPLVVKAASVPLSAQPANQKPGQPAAAAVKPAHVNTDASSPSPIASRLDSPAAKKVSIPSQQPLSQAPAMTPRSNTAAIAPASVAVAVPPLKPLSSAKPSPVSAKEPTPSSTSSSTSAPAAAPSAAPEKPAFLMKTKPARPAPAASAQTSASPKPPASSLPSAPLALPDRSTPAAQATSTPASNTVANKPQGAVVHPASPPKSLSPNSPAVAATVTKPPTPVVSTNSPPPAPSASTPVAPTAGDRALSSNQQDTAVDKDIAVNTAGAVAIAVPPPEMKASVSASAPAGRSRLAPTLDSTGHPIPSEVKRSPVPTVPQQVVKPAASMPAPAPAKAQPTANAAASVEIPSTIAVIPSSPSVSVPPLGRQDTVPAPAASPPTANSSQKVVNSGAEALSSLRQQSYALASSSSNPLPSTSSPPSRAAKVSVPAGAAGATAQQLRPSQVVADAESTPMPPVSVPAIQSAPSAAPTVTVPALQSAPVSTPAALPTLPASSTPAVSVPALQPTTTPSSVMEPSQTGRFGQSSERPTPATVVEFGQPLPSMPLNSQSGMPTQPQVNSFKGMGQVIPPSAPDVLLPAGTPLNLQYPGGQQLSLRTDSPHQEVLLLKTEIRDAVGKIIAPEGSMVIGRFETSSTGSRFITQAIALQGRNVPLVAQSDMLAGNRKISDNQIVRNSGIGALAGGVIGGVSGSAGLGVLGGAATGAAVTFLTSPKPATIQPGQVVQVRLLQDLRSL